MEKTLVTGATGLVGFNILQSLLRRHRPVKALVRSLERGQELLPESVELIVGDITVADSVRAAMTDCSVVYHAAGIPEQWLPNPGLFADVNDQGTQNMVQAALSIGVDKFVYISAMDVFDGRAEEWFNESQLASVPKRTPYERSKQAADRRVAEAVEQGLPGVFIHPASVYGPGPTTSSTLNRFFLRLATGLVPMVPPGLLPVVFAPDVADACLAAEERAAIGERFIVFESLRTFQDIANVFFEELGMARRPAEMPLWMARAGALAGEWRAKILKIPPLIHMGQLNSLQCTAFPLGDQAKHRLEWKPTDFESGLRSTCRYLFTKTQPMWQEYAS